MKYQHIFSPLKIRDCTLENRIVMPSMGTLMASDHAFVTDQVIDYYVERAKGGKLNVEVVQNGRTRKFTLREGATINCKL